MPPNRYQQFNNSNLVQEISYSSPANRQCTALQEDGSICRKRLLQPEYKLCLPHHQEYLKLYKSYKYQEVIYQDIEIDIYDRSATTKRDIATKIDVGKRTARLRSQVNRRFFSLNAAEDNRTHIQEILKLKFEVHRLKEILKDWGTEFQPGEPTLLSPGIITRATRFLLTAVVKALGVTIVFGSLLSLIVAITPRSTLDRYLKKIRGETNVN